MAENVHQCPINGCEEQVPAHYCMCAAHWKQVPPPIQAAVKEGYKLYSADRANRACYIGAVRLAIASANGEIEER